MTESNTNVVSLLKSLVERFNSLKKDVELLKEKGVCQSASEPEAESSLELNIVRNTVTPRESDNTSA